MAASKPTILTIAGLDPSGRAGLLRDIETCREVGADVVAICTALTVQPIAGAGRVEWVLPELILDQLDMLVSEQQIKAVKIGLIESAELIDNICRMVPDHIPIVWDPVLSSSSGMIFHEDPAAFRTALTGVSCATPNYEELGNLFPGEDPDRAAARWSSTAGMRSAAVVLKGGHDDLRKAVDRVYQDGKKLSEFEPQALFNAQLRGTGCIFSTVLATGLGEGLGLEQAAEMAKKFVSSALSRAEENLQAYV